MTARRREDRGAEDGAGPSPGSDRAPGGPLWTRTTDLTVISRALLPPELKAHGMRRVAGGRSERRAPAAPREAAAGRRREALTPEGVERPPVGRRVTTP